jgi:FKBP-type peptidyl-prolyl cis-trans isomerase FkpA
MNAFFRAASLLLIAPAVLGLAGCAADTGTGASGGVTQLEVVELKAGTGAEAATGKRVGVRYTGWLYNENAAEHKGTQFDSGVLPPFVLGSGAVIRGWDLGLVGLKVGGQRRLTIPPSLAYGSSGQGTIPPNATLIFDVELLTVQ